ncbi:MAG: hypothetical protein IPL49_10800 [Saprospirales bacterium]|nr:hypothetical protein [Saprospirales bacterium]
MPKAGDLEEKENDFCQYEKNTPLEAGGISGSYFVKNVLTGTSIPKLKKKRVERRLVFAQWIVDVLSPDLSADAYLERRIG